jgi:hypothetical protein
MIATVLPNVAGGQAGVPEQHRISAKAGAVDPVRLGGGPALSELEAMRGVVAGIPFADCGPPGRRPGQKLDGASIPATLEFLRRNGLHTLVDGYGIHLYPSNDDPRRPVSERIASLNERALAMCTPIMPC